MTRGRKKRPDFDFSDIEKAKNDVRQYFNSVPRDCLLSFDELFQLFENDCNQFATIGKLAGVTRERIRQMYDTYFKGFFPRRQSGRKRQRICIRKKVVKRKSEAKAITDDSPAGVSAHLAAKNNLPFERKLNRHENQFMLHRREISINGHKCAVRTACKNTKGPYWSFGVRGRDVRYSEFVICIALQSGEPILTYVIPAKELEGTSAIFMRSEAIPRRRETPWTKRHDWSRYREAWHLLGEPKTVAA